MGFDTIEINLVIFYFGKYYMNETELGEIKNGEGKEKEEGCIGFMI